MAKRLGDIGIGPNTTVVLHGNPVQYGTYVFWMLTMAGHADLRVLDGTRTKWVAENRPLSTETPHVEPVTYPAPAPGNASMRLGREAVRERLGVPGCLILDGRTPEEYAGLTVGARAMTRAPESFKNCATNCPTRPIPNTATTSPNRGSALRTA